MLTAMQERFCQNLADGLNHTDAYRQAGYGGDSSPVTVNNEAYDLSRHPDIPPRVEELVSRQRTLADCDKALVVQRALRNCDKAYSERQYAASNGALGIIVDVQGLKVTKIEATVDVQHHILPNLSMEQLKGLVEKAERAALELGLSVVEGEVVEEHG